MNCPNGENGRRRRSIKLTQSEAVKMNTECHTFTCALCALNNGNMMMYARLKCVVIFIYFLLKLIQHVPPPQ